MLSVLIPTYDHDPSSLLEQLLRQRRATDRNIEIIVLDDASSFDISKVQIKYNGLEHVTIERLEKNLGRSAIRHELAERAAYDKLLFLDGDVIPLKDDFLERYVKNIHQPVVVGGICYESKKPADKDLVLRWKYGLKREQRTASQRMVSPFSQFMASNLMIDRLIFLRIPIDKSIKGYGHEDTLMGLYLIHNDIRVHHIDNPAVHNGLDEAGIFLEKSLTGLKNLAMLYRSGKVDRNVKIVDAYFKLSSKGLTGIYAALMGMFIPSIESNLKGNDPNLWLFDHWKLYHFCQNMSQPEKTSS